MQKQVDILVSKNQVLQILYCTLNTVHIRKQHKLAIMDKKPTKPTKICSSITIAYSVKHKQ